MNNPDYFEPSSDYPMCFGTFCTTLGLLCDAMRGGPAWGFVLLATLNVSFLILRVWWGAHKAKITGLRLVRIYPHGAKSTDGVCLQRYSLPPIPDQDSPKRSCLLSTSLDLKGCLAVYHETGLSVRIEGLGSSNMRIEVPSLPRYVYGIRFKEGWVDVYLYSQTREQKTRIEEAKSAALATLHAHKSPDLTSPFSIAPGHSPDFPSLGEDR